MLRESRCARRKAGRQAAIAADPAVQATLRIVLERAGHAVVVAGDGRKELAIFEAGDFDLLILGIMPGMAGG
jgi:DNA-binding response OmpR family regulator